METSRFDQLVRSLSNSSSRRHALRLLGASAATGLAAVTGVRAAEAKGIADAKKKRRRKKKRKNKRQPTFCPAGQQIGTVSVPATGATVTTPALRAGQRYRLRAVGFWSTNATFGNDAFAAFPFANPTTPEPVFQGVRLGLAVDGGSPDEWGTYNLDHVYERVVEGQGQPLSLRFTDPITADNSGSLLVDVSCA